MIDIGVTEFAGPVALRLDKANRHGLVTGATGTGKTVTLQRLAEQFSLAGVPVFAADIKGDLSGMAVQGDLNSVACEKTLGLGRTFVPQSFPVRFWDLFGEHGTKIRTSVQEIGPLMLSAMLRLNETQAGALAIAFKKSEAERSFMLTLDDLRYTLTDMLDDRENVCRDYGNVTAASISAIQRNLLALESQGGDHLFNEPPFDIADLMQTADGAGIINLLHADRLIEAPKLYALFLLWLLSRLFNALPEAGDLDKPKMVFFDEAHLLFRDAPKPLLEQIERLVRLVRSKGVGVFFVTQSPNDVPDAVLAQLGNRIQHALRAYTQKDQRMVRASAAAFRPNPDLDIKAEITAMGVGEALVSVLDRDGIPSVTQKVRVIPPAAQIGPISDDERRAFIEACPMTAKYAGLEDDNKAGWQFERRMRRARGLPVDEDAVYTAPETDLYLKHVPYWYQPEPEDQPSRVWLAVKAMLWAAVSVGAAALTLPALV